MGLACEEQETVIQYNRDDGYATVYTSDSTTITKLDHLCEDSPEFYKLDRVVTANGETVAKFYKVTDKKMISFRGKKRVLTDEQKESFAERMKTFRNQNYAELSQTE